MKSIIKEYEQKLNKIIETVPKNELARKMNVAPRTVRNWFHDIGSIKMKYAEEIDKIYCEVTK